jgi:endonuclease/exonuclease/phosphatase family metal-dependent hydrolase
MVNASRLRRGIPLIAISVLLALIVAVPQAASGQSPGTNQGTTGDDMDVNREQKITVMSRNVYLGTDLTPIVASFSTGDPETIKTAVDKGWSNIKKTNLPERAEALADEIKQSKPMLINLQEAELYRTGRPDAFTDPTPATNVDMDFLVILQEKLADRGLDYTPVQVTENFDFEVPGHEQDLRLTDRDAILAPTELLQSGELQLSKVEAHSFNDGNLLSLPNGLPITRGWGQVDVSTGGHDFRLINTHLEPECFAAHCDPQVAAFINDLQMRQANEILLGPANPDTTDLPVILAGDYNSRADGTGTGTYANLIGAGFADTWSSTHRKELGYTCCQAADLRNRPSALDQRIDLVLFRNGEGKDLRALEADILGEKLVDRTPSGLWPSDHAGVVATLAWKDDQREPVGR